MNTRKLINQTPVDEWELLNETVGRRPGPGTPLFEPHGSNPCFCGSYFATGVKNNMKLLAQLETVK